MDGLHAGKYCDKLLLVLGRVAEQAFIGLKNSSGIALIKAFRDRLRKVIGQHLLVVERNVGRLRKNWVR